MQIGILEPDGFSRDATALLQELGEVVPYRGDDLHVFLAPLDALFIRLAYRIDDTFLAMTPRLRWLCSPTTGHNHIAEASLAKRGVRLLSLRGERAFLETIRATPEHTLGLMIALLRRYKRAFDVIRSGLWDRDMCRGEELYGNRVGIIGLGRVGYRVASYCDALGAEVFWCDKSEVPAQSNWHRLPDARSVIDASRMVVLCASYQLGQPPVIGREEISALEGRYFINTARGELVDESMLLDSIRENRLLGAALDVIAGESGINRLDEWRALVPERNLVITPHIAGATFESMARTESFIAEQLRTAVRAEKPE